MSSNDPIAPEQWGSDHLSTLLYLETRVVDHGGTIAPEKMRGRNSGYPCRLREGERPEHGDMDCVADMRAAGVLTGGERNTFDAWRSGEGPDPKRQPLKPVALTDAGWRLAHLVRRRRAEAKAWPTAAEVVKAIKGRPSVAQEG